MSIVAVVDVINNAANFQIYVVGDVLASFTLSPNTGKVECSSVASDTDILLAEWQDDLLNIRKWFELCELNFTIANSQPPIDTQQQFTKSIDVSAQNCLISGYSFNQQYNYGTGLMTIFARDATILFWGELTKFLQFNEELIRKL